MCCLELLPDAADAATVDAMCRCMGLQPDAEIDIKSSVDAMCWWRGL